MIIAASLEQIDRTFFETIRRVLVSMGHLPNIDSFTGNPTGYATAKGNVTTLVDVKGVGNSESRNKKSAHQIVINRKTTTPSDFGGGTIYYIPNKNGNDETISYTKKRSPQMASNIVYEVRIITNSMKMERLLTTVMNKAIGFRKHLKIEENGTLTGASYLVVFTGDVDVSSTDFTEKLFNYTFMDVWLADTEEVIKEDVPVLTEIEIKIQNKSDGKYETNTVE